MAQTGDQSLKIVGEFFFIYFHANRQSVLIKWLPNLVKRRWIREYSSSLCLPKDYIFFTITVLVAMTYIAIYRIP